MRRRASRGLFAFLAAFAFLAIVSTAGAAALPSGFAETQVASGLSAPTAMAFAPDGRLFVAEQGGRLRVIKNGTLLATPFLTVTVDSAGERGLLGVAFDPAFASNGFVYVYYTATTPRCTTASAASPPSGDVAAAGSEVPILDLDDLSSGNEPQRRRDPLRPGRQALRRRRRQRQRRELADARQPARQDPADQRRRHDPGRQPVLRHRRRETTARSGRWGCATRSRSPSSPARRGCSSTTSARTPGRRSTTASPARTTAGRRPEGPTTDPRFRGPIFWYGHGTGPTTGCAITGGAFYNPPTVQFPASYVGNYFFADFCSGWIRNLDPANGNTVRDFATGAAAPVDLAVASDGTLYYLTRGGTCGQRLPRRATPDPPRRRSRRSRRARRSAPARPSASASRPPARRRCRTSGSAMV